MYVYSLLIADLKRTDNPTVPETNLLLWRELTKSADQPKHSAMRVRTYIMQILFLPKPFIVYQ